MAEEKPRTLKVLEALSKRTEPSSPADIGIVIGVSPRDTGKTLYDLGRAGFAKKPDEKQSLWLITDEGRKYIENPPVLSDRPLKPTLSPSTQTDHQSVHSDRPSESPPPEPPGEEQPETVPSQADLFRAEGERIGFGSRKGDIKLEAVVTYVERTANLDDPSSVWNALTEMGVANDVKKRWLKLYSQNLPGVEISPELKAKLEAGIDDKVSEKDVSPKPKRFSIINGEIIGDPEGDYNFNEALKLLAQQKGVPGDQINPLASIIEAMKLGPDMATATLTAMIPLITREPPKTDNTMIQDLQQRIVQLADDKHKVEMDSLRAEMRSGQKPPESSQEIQALSKQIDNYREQLHNEQLTRIQDQNQAQVKELTDSLKRLEQRIAAATEGKEAESKIGLMGKGLEAVASELKGVRADIKPLAQNLLERKIAPSVRTAAEKAGLSAGLDKGIEQSKEATELENDLFFGKES